jgi:hypothetical protein
MAEPRSSEMEPEFTTAPELTDVYLLTYTLLQNKKRRTRRSTILQNSSGIWKIVYHQETIVE